MKNTFEMWDDYYTTLNTDSYARPPQSYWDFPTVNRVVLDLLIDQFKTIIPRTKGVLGLFSKGTSMVELGCGGANVSLHLLQHGLIHKSLMVDFSDKIKKYVENAIEAEGFPHAKFLKADVLKLKIKEKFDIVYSGGLLDHLDGKELEKAFATHVKLCKKGGYVITVVPYNSRLMYMVKTGTGIPEAKLNYKLFQLDEMLNHFRKHKLEIIYNSRNAVSQRPHIVNKLPFKSKQSNLVLWGIHNLHLLWKVYEFFEREFPLMVPRDFFVQISDLVLLFGTLHGDYVVTIGRKMR